VGLGKVSDNVVQNVIKNSVNLFKNCLWEGKFGLQK
jgi:hypothetical protein